MEPAARGMPQRQAGHDFGLAEPRRRHERDEFGATDPSRVVRVGLGEASVHERVQKE